MRRAATANEMNSRAEPEWFGSTADQQRFHGAAAGWGLRAPDPSRCVRHGQRGSVRHREIEAGVTHGFQPLQWSLERITDSEIEDQFIDVTDAENEFGEQANCTDFELSTGTDL